MSDCGCERMHSEPSMKEPWLHKIAAPNTCIKSKRKQIIYIHRVRVTKLRRRYLAHIDYAESQHKGAWPHCAPGSDPCFGSNNTVYHKEITSVRHPPKFACQR